MAGQPVNPYLSPNASRPDRHLKWAHLASIRTHLHHQPMEAVTDTQLEEAERTRMTHELERVQLETISWAVRAVSKGSHHSSNSKVHQTQCRHPRCRMPVIPEAQMARTLVNR